MATTFRQRVLVGNHRQDLAARLAFGSATSPPLLRDLVEPVWEKSNEQAAMPEAGDLPFRNTVACQQRRQYQVHDV